MVLHVPACCWLCPSAILCPKIGIITWLVQNLLHGKPCHGQAECCLASGGNELQAPHSDDGGKRVHKPYQLQRLVFEGSLRSTVVHMFGG